MTKPFLHFFLYIIFTFLFFSRAHGLEVKGEVTNFPPRLLEVSDKKIDFAIVLEAIKKENYLNYDLDKVMSEKNKDIQIKFFKGYIPSNLVFPRQKEYFSIFSFILDSTNYSLSTTPKDWINLKAIHGNFNMDKVFDEFRSGTPLVALVDYFNFKSGGSVSLNTGHSRDNQNIALKEFELNTKRIVKSPKIGDNESILTLAMNREQDLFFPSDIKYLKSESQVELSFQSGEDKSDLNVFAMKMDAIKTSTYSDHRDLRLIAGTRVKPHHKLFELDFKKASISFEPLTSNTPLTFLDTTKAPEVVGYKLKMYPPKLLPGLSEMATVVRLVRSERVISARIIYDLNSTLKKQVYPGWITEVPLFESKELVRKNGITYRYEVLFVGSRSGSQNVIDLNNYTHASKHFIELDNSSITQ